MKVLVVGFSKTGTKSLNAALHILGYSVYDYEDNFYNLRKQWTKILTKDGTKKDFYEMYKDVDATMDIPAVVFWEEILEAFPDCKLIFMKRKNEDEWLKSWKKQAESIGASPMANFLCYTSFTTRAMYRYSQHVGRVVFGSTSTKFNEMFRGISSTVAKKRYRDHNTSVLTHAPKDQLLKFNLSDGWKPLCEFLNKPTPDVAFPHQNKGATLLKEWRKSSPVIHRMMREMVITISVLFGLIGIVSYVAVTRNWVSWLWAYILRA